MKKIKILSGIVVIIGTLFLSCPTNTNNSNNEKIKITKEKIKAKNNKKEIANEAEAVSEPAIEIATSECVQSQYINEEDCMPNEFVTGWIKTNANIRVLPDITADIITTLSTGSQIEYCKANEYWSYIQYNEEIYYMYNELISDTEIVTPNYKDYNTPYSKRMSFMPYQAITSKSSPQYKLQRIAYTGNYGIRQVNGRYCVAVGSAYTTIIGQYFDLVLDNGTVIPCILADCKADIHTDSTNRISADGSLAEFVVDKRSLDTMTRKMGDIVYCTPEWKGTIVKIRIYDFIEEF